MLNELVKGRIYQGMAEGIEGVLNEALGVIDTLASEFQQDSRVRAADPEMALVVRSALGEAAQKDLPKIRAAGRNAIQEARQSLQNPFSQHFPSELLGELDRLEADGGSSRNKLQEAQMTVTEAQKKDGLKANQLAQEFQELAPSRFLRFWVRWRLRKFIRLEQRLVQASLRLAALRTLEEAVERVLARVSELRQELSTAEATVAQAIGLVQLPELTPRTYQVDKWSTGSEQQLLEQLESPAVLRALAEGVRADLPRLSPEQLLEQLRNDALKRITPLRVDLLEGEKLSQLIRWQGAPTATLRSELRDAQLRLRYITIAVGPQEYKERLLEELRGAIGGSYDPCFIPHEEDRIILVTMAHHVPLWGLEEIVKMRDSLRQYEQRSGKKLRVRRIDYFAEPLCSPKYRELLLLGKLAGIIKEVPSGDSSSFILDGQRRSRAEVLEELTFDRKLRKRIQQRWEQLAARGEARAHIAVNGQLGQQLLARVDEEAWEDPNLLWSQLLRAAHSILAEEERSKENALADLH